MRTVKEVLELRAACYKAMEEIGLRAKEQKRPFTADEEAQWSRADAEFNAYTEEIKRIEKMQSIDSEVERLREEVFLPESNREKASLLERWMENALYGPAFSSEEARKMMMDTRAVTSRGSGNGLYVVPEEFSQMLEIYLKAYGGMYEACRMMRTQKGGNMPYPTNDDTSSTGQWVAEPRTSEVTSRAFTFDKKTFASYTWSEVLKIEWEFIQDEDVSFVASVMAELVGTSFGRALNKSLTDGNGSGKPTGILDASNGASTGKTAASATAITKSELIDLMHSVNSAYRNGPKVGFMFSDTTLAALKKLDFGTTDTTPLWLPSFREGEPDRILGKPYWVNDDFPTIATGRKTVAFGDFNKYVLRMVKDFSLIRLDERFATELATGWVAWARVDGKLLNNSAVKVLVQA